MPTIADLYYFAHQPDNPLPPPIILIHGAGGTHLHYPPELRRLNDRRIYAPDLPGHGKSEGLGRQTVPDYAQTLQEFMDALDLPAALIIGHSMGSAIALQLALDAPDRVLALVLLGSGSRLRVAPSILENTANEATFPLAVKMITEWAYGSQTPAQIKELSAQRMRETRPAVLHGDFSACDNFDISESLPQIRQPTQIICGAEDKLTPPKYAKYLHENLPNAQLTIIPEAGHMVMLEKPHLVAKNVEEFIRKLSLPSETQNPVAN